MTSIRALAAATAITAALVLATTGPALAEDATGVQFGQHVQDCAQIMGFTGQHNPGMHHGYAGWDGMTCND